MNYYFTESKWYGPLENGIDFNNDDEAKEYYLSLPSGDSLIPEFAGMVKESNKDFMWKYKQGTKPPVFIAVLPYEPEGELTQTAVPVAEEGFNKDEMQKVQDDIDSVMKGKIVDKAKLIGISAISNDELCDIVQNACQLINGFKPDAVEGNYWSDWDESVLQSLIEILRRTQPAYGKEEGKQTFSGEDMIGFLDWAKKWFTPIEGTEIWMASAKTYVKGNPPDLSEYITADLFLQYTEYLKTKQ